MFDFAAARRMMVDGQVRTSDVTDSRVIGAMLDIPRERFLPASKYALAYLDLDVPVSDVSEGKSGRCLLKPMTIGRMLQALAPQPQERALDAGCASGYSSALLARLCGSVVALEEESGAHHLAKTTLATEKAVTLVHGPLPAGWPASAPYDVIFLGGAVEFAPESLLEQLRDGGRLVCILGRGPAAKAMLYRRDGDEFGSRPLFDAAAPVLPGFIRPPAFVF